jgi:hypothetical protein
MILHNSKPLTIIHSFKPLTILHNPKPLTMPKPPCSSPFPVAVIPVWAAAGFTSSRIITPAGAAAAAAAAAAMGVMMFSSMPELAYRSSSEVGCTAN